MKVGWVPIPFKISGMQFYPILTSILLSSQPIYHTVTVTATKAQGMRWNNSMHQMFE